MKATKKGSKKSAERNKGQQGRLRSVTNKDGTPKVKDQDGQRPPVAVNLDDREEDGA